MVAMPVTDNEKSQKLNNKEGDIVRCGESKKKILAKK
jgi:hypothetical protein